MDCKFFRTESKCLLFLLRFGQLMFRSEKLTAGGNKCFVTTLEQATCVTVRWDLCSRKVVLSLV